jgi:hypothetical protein
MGRKGVSIRKPKKTKSVSNDSLSGSSSIHPGENSPVQSLLKDKGDQLNRGVPNPATGPNKKNRKGK